MDVRKTGINRYILPARGDMKVDALLFLREKLLPGAVEDGSLEQLSQAASLPGTLAALGMPDIHWGFGLPIGGVLVGDVKAGVISAGAVGMDINCGVRLLVPGLSKEDLGREELKALMSRIVDVIPTGIGKKSSLPEIARLNVEDVLVGGAPALVKKGFGTVDDLTFCEEGGVCPGGDPEKISRQAHRRSNQLGTIGGGNHFIEIGFVRQVYEGKTASAFGLKEGALTLMIHTGSRGLGHQICNDYSRLMSRCAANYGIKLPNRGLASVPLESQEGKDYLAAMSCAVNFAFANRQVIAHCIRGVFQEMYPGRKVKQVYDVAHNIAKLEEVDGTPYLIHRKGATRALPPNHPQNPPSYRETGHPAIIPGTMGTFSYVVVGTPSIKEAYNSVNHGAGRVMSRKKAKETFDARDIDRQLDRVLVSARDRKAIIDEAPLAYKNIDEVVDTLAEIGMTRKVVQLQPLAVIKGVG